jgi:hypothetical protein
LSKKLQLTGLFCERDARNGRHGNRSQPGPASVRPEQLACGRAAAVS